MGKKLAAVVLILALSASLCGCGGLFDKEYVSVSDYVPAAGDDDEPDARITVKTFSELKRALVKLVSAGGTESTVMFDPAYEGDTTEDMASACWQVRTRDALCAYCVENIAYELTKIVTYYEANIRITYSEAGQSVGDIIQMQYSAGLGEAIKNAYETGRTKLVVLISHSSYSAENVELYAGKVYNEYPASSTASPKVNVNMFSGTGMQRLYEINIDYGMSAAELDARRSEIERLDPFADENTEDMDAADKALLACEYLTANCAYSDEAALNNVYYALIGRQANSEGIALSYVELCRRLGVSCQIVYGQRDWQDYCWNIVGIDGQYYHVDVGRCITGGVESGFLLKDETMWVDHRWDVESYPHCTGALTYGEVAS